MIRGPFEESTNEFSIHRGKIEQSNDRAEQTAITEDGPVMGYAEPIYS